MNNVGERPTYKPSGSRDQSRKHRPRTRFVNSGWICGFRPVLAAFLGPKELIERAEWDSAEEALCSRFLIVEPLAESAKKVRQDHNLSLADAGIATADSSPLKRFEMTMWRGVG